MRGPVTRLIYDPGGLIPTDVYAPLAEAIGQLDSNIAPDVRTAANKAASKQSYLRDQSGVPSTSSRKRHLHRPDHRLVGPGQNDGTGYVDPSRSIDGDGSLTQSDSAYRSFFCHSAPTSARARPTATTTTTRAAGSSRWARIPTKAAN